MKNKPDNTIKWITAIVFACFVYYWFVRMNGYHTLFYQEQTQLFQFNRFYFETYWNQPGGLIHYIGSFFTQFSYFIYLGGIIYSVAVLGIAALSDRIWKNYGMGNGFFIPWIPAICMLFANVDLNFTLTYSLAILFVLVFFRMYTGIGKRHIISAVILLFLSYLILGGNMFLLALLIIIDKLYTRRKQFSSIIFPILLLILICLLLPYPFWRYWYVTPLEEAYFSNTPFTLFYPNYLYMAVWIGIPVLLSFGLLLQKFFRSKSNKPLLTASINSILVVFCLVLGTIAVYNPQTNQTVKMYYDLENGQQEKVIANAKKVLPSELTSYFTNIALNETGQLGNKMFSYDQVGPSGLLLGRKNGYFNRFSMGILFYHLGIIAEAKHCAFEALVGNSNFKEPNTQTLKYLVTTSILQRNKADFDKYIWYFDHSLFYRKWADTQKTEMQKALSNPEYQPEYLPEPARFADFFINYKHPHLALMHLLENDPYHQAAFEYLMAFYLLSKDFDGAKDCMDKYYGNFNYPEMPIHFEEFLALYYHSTKSASVIYPVSKEMSERYETYRLMTLAKASDEITEQLKSRYGNTYWYYLSFPLSSSSNPYESEIKAIY